MKFNTAVCGLALTLLNVAHGSTECANAMNSAFDKLAKQASSFDAVVGGEVPEECQPGHGILDDSSLSSQPRTHLDTFCLFDGDGIDTTVVTYSYDINLSAANDDDYLNMVASVWNTFINTSNANHCGSSLYYRADGISGEGWNIWAESYDSAPDTCTPSEENALALTVMNSLLQLYEEKKTSYCMVYRDSSTWRGVVRVLYPNETRYASPADIPCYTINPGFSVVDDCYL